MNKFITGEIQKATSTTHDGLFVLNEESEDRMGDIIEVAGWDLKNFKKNPVALWMHDHDKPIGTWGNVRVEGKQLLGELKLATTNLARMAKQLIEDGVLKAVSVGFRPKEHEPIDEKEPYGAWRIKAAELFEVSLVSVPAHQNALLLSKSLGLSPAERKLIFAKGEDTKVESGKRIVELARQDLDQIREMLGRRP